MGTMAELSPTEITKVIDVLYKSSGVDFSNYATSSFKRRIIRFIEINKICDFNEFLKRIRSDQVYTEMLIKEISVTVTEMFRDPSFWVVMHDNILPQICRNSSINIWHAACSTGEEVLSMAILLKESNLFKHSRIIATDINYDALEVAKRGVYPLKYQETNNRNYEQFGGNGKLSDYYTVVGDTVQFDKSLIDNVDFRRHNLAQDGPFSTFDLIICRNVLIYFNFDLQEKVIQTFEMSMSKGSFLGIGSKESIRWFNTSRFFEEESFEEKIYCKVADRENHHRINTRYLQKML
jgi:chemotaxis protein methyltransferase CheR